MIWPFSAVKKKDPRINHDLDHDDQQAGADATKAKAELRKLRYDLERSKIMLEAEREELRLRTDIEEYRQRYEDLQDSRDDGSDDPDESGGSLADQAMLALVTGILGPKAAPGATIPAQVTQSQPLPDGEPTDQQLRMIWQKLPDNYKEQALKLTQ